MKIFSISIPRSIERHAYIQRHLREKTRLPWEVVGIDGAMLRLNGGDWPHAPHLSNAQVGCALSHALACQKIVEQDLPAALIVEDDVSLPEDIDDILAALANEIRPEEMISLYNRTFKPERFSTHSAVQVGRRQLVYPSTPHIMRTAAAYFIGVDAARKLAAMNTPVKYVADDWKAFHAEGAIDCFRLLHPIPIRLVPFESTLSYDHGKRLLRLAKRALSAIPFGGRIRAVRRQYVQRRRERNVVLEDKPTMFSPSARDASSPA